MTIFMWRFLQKKTKAIIGTSVFYTILMTIFIILEILNLRLFVVSNIIYPKGIIAIITVIFMITISWIIMFYKIKLFIKIIVAFVMLVSMFFLGIVWLSYVSSERQIIKIEVSDDIDVIVAERANLFRGKDQYFYIVENGIFLILLIDNHTSEFRYGNYTVEYIDDDTFAIIYEYTNVQDIYLFFDVIDDKVYFSSKSYVSS